MIRSHRRWIAVFEQHVAKRKNTVLFEIIRLAFRTLGSNKPRAFLTMLGISIGVGAVITLIAVGAGVQKYITGQFSKAGTTLIAVVPGRVSRGGGGGGAAFGVQQAALTIGDFRAVSQNVDGITSSAADFLRVGNLAFEGHTSEVSVAGVTSGYSAVRNWNIKIGRFFDETDGAARNRVVILGQTVVNDLFPDGGDPVDSAILINNQTFRVIGVMEVRGSTFAGDQDAIALVPLDTAQDRLFADASRGAVGGEKFISNMYLQAADDNARDVVKQQTSELLRARHRIGDGDDNDFTVVTSGELINTFGAVLGVLTAFLGAIAAISLIVGGIGIMNIMLVSVTERTREIGLRKAIGAKPRIILSQFLIEAIFLSVMGGLVGVVVGVAGAWGIGKAASFEPIVSLQTIALAVGFSMLVGLVFGVYPARQASRLSPIEALRYE